MDGSKFDVSTSNDIIMQTKNMISIINGMSFGLQEYRDFISKYPNAK